MNDNRSHPQPHGESLMSAVRGSKKPWLVQVDVYLENDDPVDFTISSSLPGKYARGEKNPILQFHNNHRPGFDILFLLHDGTGKGYQFARDLDEAVWSRIGDVCPDERCDPPIFEPKSVHGPDDNNPPRLLVHFDNPDPDKTGSGIGRFRYTLNVSTNGSKPYKHLDPGGDGMNGARTLLR